MNTLLFQRFFFKKPIEIADLPEGKGDEIIALPEKIIIKADNQSLKKNLAEILAKAKLGEKDPLLVTFYFQQNISEADRNYASMFFTLCQPLQDAWVYKTMRKYAPDIYKSEINELVTMYEALPGDIFNDDGDPKKRQIALSIYTILLENPANDIELILQTDNANRSDWERYIAALRELIHEEPNAKLYLRLPIVSNAPYQVQITTEINGDRYYEIKKESAKNIKRKQ